MKTPMQELIERLNNVKPTEFCSIETIKGWAKSLLEKEKEQIMDAYTAVEYLATQYDWLISLELTRKVSGPIIDEYRAKFLKRAKEMEREQKLQFAEDYHKSKINNE